MVAITNLLSKYTILHGMRITFVVTIQSVARKWTAKYQKTETMTQITLSTT